jgi:hypothetical protein
LEEIRSRKGHLEHSQKELEDAIKSDSNDEDLILAFNENKDTLVRMDQHISDIILELSKQDPNFKHGDYFEIITPMSLNQSIPQSTPQHQPVVVNNENSDRELDHEDTSNGIYL